MTLKDLVRRPVAPAAWIEGDNIPWDDPGFSVRMLQEHLTQSHDAASRRYETIDRQVAWIHRTLLWQRPTRILDLGCGPGLYTARLAQLGHHCVGVDYSPASIAYARERAAEGSLRCAYIEGDFRRVEFGSGVGLAMMIYGEFNTLRPDAADKILRRIHAALVPDGLLLLEPHTFEGVRSQSDRQTVWRSYTRGLFSDSPHLLLEENHWDEWSRQLTTRYFVVDAESAAVTRFARTMQAYSREEYVRLIESAGFGDVRLLASLTDDPDSVQEGLHAIVARKL